VSEKTLQGGKKQKCSTVGETKTKPLVTLTC